jgi:hypothetical protein
VRLGVVMLVVMAARLIDRGLLRIGRGKGATALGAAERLRSGGGSVRRHRRGNRGRDVTTKSTESVSKP